eukprot:scaffold366207_cov31-Prasinocladus_malaysianus.AAC.1
MLDAMEPQDRFSVERLLSQLEAPQHEEQTNHSPAEYQHSSGHSSPFPQEEPEFQESAYQPPEAPPAAPSPK